jgi:D-alanyl-D-alanine carboxypeptidase
MSEIHQWGWLGHTGETPGHNTTLYYNSELHATAIVEVNNDIEVGECQTGASAAADGGQDIPCTESAEYIFGALSDELGRPFAVER